MGIVRINDCSFKGLVKKAGWMLHKVLIQGILIGNQDYERVSSGTPHSSSSLPGINDGSRVSD